MSQFTPEQIFADYHIILNNVEDTELNIFPEEPNMDFGILTLKTIQTKIDKNAVLFKFDIDISGSMCEMVGKGVSKIQYLKSTFKNMILFLAEQVNSKIYIHVSVFNSKYVVLIDTVCITPENHLELIEKVENIDPCTSTNIEKTFRESSKIIADYLEQFPSHKVAYILLTDGNATEGNVNNDYLVSLLPKGCEVFCIGYGKDHCAKLLNDCGEYYFVNDFEITGKVYGEIVFAMLYVALTDITIIMKDSAKIYNAFTNEWVSSLSIPKIYGDKEVTFSLKCPKDIVQCSATIYGKIIGEPQMTYSGQICTSEPVELCVIYKLPDLVEVADGSIVPVDLRKYMYKQATQQFLYECIEISSTYRNTLDNNNKIRTYTENIRAFYRKVKKYMAENNLQADVFMKILCDDIYTSYKTIGRETSATFTVMRQRAHAREMTYRTGTDTLCEYQDFRTSQTPCVGIGRQASITLDYEEETQYYEEDEDEQTVDLYNNDEGEDDLQRYVSNTQRDEEVITSPTLTQVIRGVSRL
jgi:hypothetical protein